MPAVPGENLLTTLFADVHYSFTDPSTKPQYHRFDRGSYVYIYHNPTEARAKLEIANHAGTPDQDAFSGSLGSASVQYSYKQPTLCTLILDAYIQDERQWHLPAYDMGNERRALHKLHTVDIYLWTEKDAAVFMRHLRAMMPASRLEIKDAPAPVAQASSLAEHRSSMSPVVQQLETTAIDAHFLPRAESVLSVQSLTGPATPATGATTSPPQSPPQAALMAYNPAAPSAPEPIAYREKTPPPPEDANGTGLTGPMPQYASVPGAYLSSNQTTPQQAYFPGVPSQASHPPPAATFAGPPQGASPDPMPRSYSGGLPPPPRPPGPSVYAQSQQQYAPSFAGPPVDYGAQSTPPSSHQQPFHRQTSYGGPAPAQPASPPPQTRSFHRQSVFGGPPTAQNASYPQQTQAQSANYAASPGFGPSLASPGLPPTPGYQQMQQPPTPSVPPAYGTHTPLQSPGLPPPPPTQPPQASQTHQQPPIVHAYGQYNYAAASAQPTHNQYGAYTGDVHAQPYRPTEAEAAHGHHGAAVAKPPSERRDSGRARLEDRVGGVEKRVGGFLKRLDRLI